MWDLQKLRGDLQKWQCDSRFLEMWFLVRRQMCVLFSLDTIRQAASPHFKIRDGQSPWSRLLWRLQLLCHWKQWYMWWCWSSFFASNVYMLVSQCGTCTCAGSLFVFDILASSPFSSWLQQHVAVSSLLHPSIWCWRPCNEAQLRVSVRFLWQSRFLFGFSCCDSWMFFQDNCPPSLYWQGSNSSFYRVSWRWWREYWRMPPTTLGRCEANC